MCGVKSQIPTIPHTSLLLTHLTADMSNMLLQYREAPTEFVPCRLGPDDVVKLVVIDFKGKSFGKTSFTDLQRSTYRIRTSSLPAGLTAMINASLALLKEKSFSLTDYIVEDYSGSYEKHRRKRPRKNFFAAENQPSFAPKRFDAFLKPQLTWTYENIFDELDGAYAKLISIDEDECEDFSGEAQDAVELSLFEECMRNYMVKLWVGDTCLRKTPHEQMGTQYQRTPGTIDSQDERWDKIYAAPGELGVDDNDKYSSKLTLRLVMGLAK